MSKKVMQQALEALVLWEDEAPHAWSQADENAVAALRAALAEPEQEPVSIKWTLNGDKHCGYDNWVGETPFGRILITWKSWKDFPEACVDEFPGDFTAYGKPDDVKDECEAEFRRRLGAAPTPRKPLTDEELEPLLDEVESYDSTNYDLVKFARAIERHHGITGEQT